MNLINDQWIPNMNNKKYSLLEIVQKNPQELITSSPLINAAFLRMCVALYVSSSARKMSFEEYLKERLLGIDNLFIPC